MSHFNIDGRAQRMGIKIDKDRTHVNMVECQNCYWIGRPIEVVKNAYQKTVHCPACNSQDLIGGGAEEPTKSIIDFFDVETISWSVYIDTPTVDYIKINCTTVKEPKEYVFASGHRERELRSILQST